MADDELIKDFNTLQSYPAEIHLFCPQWTDTNDDDKHNNEGKDGIDPATKKRWQSSEEVEKRKDLFFKCLQIFARQSTHAKGIQAYLQSRLDSQLSMCDACIRGYYKGKKPFKEQLLNENDEEDVDRLFQIFDENDMGRIKSNLTSALCTLREYSPSQCRLTLLSQPQIFALFEALTCEAFLRNDELLRDPFTEVFQLVQRKKLLTLGDYIPAASWFLFTSDNYRYTWAKWSWEHFQRDPTKDDFDFAIKEPLHDALRRASQSENLANVLEPLWRGLRLIIPRLNKDLIRHSLRALDVDVCRLALDHMQFDSGLLRDLLITVQSLLSTAAEDFWDAMGAISPTTVLEQIFNNPRFVRVLGENPDETVGEPLDDGFQRPSAKDMLLWIEPFMSSIKPTNQPPACRTMLSQLLVRFQNERFSKQTRLQCCRIGFSLLLQMVQNLSDDEILKTSVGRIAISDTLDIVGNHIRLILVDFRCLVGDPNDNVLTPLAMDVVRNALSLECKALKADQDSLLFQKDAHLGITSYSQIVWYNVVTELNDNNIPLATAALLGIRELVGLEMFSVKKTQENLKERTQFNTTLENLTRMVSQLFEKFADFRPERLHNLFSTQDTGSSIISALFSPDLDTYQAGVNVIKNISGQSGRREAIAYLLNTFFSTTLDCFSWCLRRISRKRSFAPAPRMLKTSTDVLEILCDSQNGILRADRTNSREVQAIKNFWHYNWQELTVIFEETEAWSIRQSDKETMTEFCRDTMQFAERFFEQYDLFANIGDSTDPKDKTSVDQDMHLSSTGAELLHHTSKTISVMVRWLRLRDEYLAATLVKLLRKLLGRFEALNMDIDDEPLNFIEKACNNGVKTILSATQKAELQRAVNDHRGGESGSITPGGGEGTTLDLKAVDSSRLGKTRGKNATIDLEAWRSKAKEHRDIITIADEPENKTSTFSGELPKRHASDVTKIRHPSSVSLPTRSGLTALKGFQKPVQLNANNMKSFKEKREREKEAKRLRDAQELARLKKHASSAEAGEGSSLTGLGVKGKDHTPHGSTMMVSSDSESDSEDEMDRELFGMADQGSKLSENFKAYRESKLQSLKQIRQAGPVKKKKIVRSAKDMRARLAPDLSTLHRTILSWEFFANGEFPPHSESTDYSLVTSTFKHPIEYQQTFQPLLVLEAWQGLLKAKEEGNFKPFEVRVSSRVSVDSFVEVISTMTLADGRELGIGEADIILLSKAENPTAAAHEPHCLARISNISRKKGVMEISYRIKPGNPLISSLAPNSLVHGVKITSITPLEREYGALVGLQYYDLCEEIIRAKPSPLLDYSDQQLAPIVSNYNVNVAQAKAVKSAVDNDAFTLIQGPPGSGKTKTIVGIVGALLTHTLGGNEATKILQPGGLGTAKPAPAPSKKLLVCAPSNAAVDELVMRLKEGVKTLTGKSQKLSLIRLGRTDVINSSVVDVTLDELVNAKLNIVNGKKLEQKKDIHAIMMEHKATSEALNMVRAVLDECKAKGKAVDHEKEREFDLLKRKKALLGQEIDNARDNSNTAARDAEINRRRVQQEILDGAHVICATLSGSGHEMFQNLSIEFETVIIDEAAQSIELSALIPLKYGCSKCILVGDPKQLPPTVLSREAARFQYEQSLFVRMQVNHPSDVHLLDTQYRMHPEISAFPSQAFYDSRLLDGPSMANLRKRPWHNSSVLGPYRFFDVKGQQQTAPKGHSLINITEVNVALQLYNRLVSDCGKYNFSGKVGIITPYKSQLKELRMRFAQRFGESILSNVEFNTTDAFQGRESEVIIFSCVRASSSKGIGFLNDIRRMNVGLTRAKCSLWVLGNSSSLMQGEFWGKLILDAKQRDRYTDGDLIKLFSKPLLTAADLIEDVEMIDAPPPEQVSSKSSSGKDSVPTPAYSPLPNEVSRQVDSKQLSAYGLERPSGVANASGGYYGLDTAQACGLCGSFEHFSNTCDNIEARQAAFGACHRCGDPSHQKRRCNAERCFECGKFGHNAPLCASRNSLSKEEKQRVRREEEDHRRYKQRTSIYQTNNRHPDDHDPKVPQIIATRKTPPPGEDNQRRPNDHWKRKRRGSPPGNTPKAPRLSSIQSAPGHNASRQDSNVAQPQGLGSAEASTAPKHHLPDGQNRGGNVNSSSVNGNRRINPNPNGPRKIIRRNKEADPFIRPKHRKPN